jgi:hypothetical protein
MVSPVPMRSISDVGCDPSHGKRQGGIVEQVPLTCVRPILARVHEVERHRTGGTKNGVHGVIVLQTSLGPEVVVPLAVFITLRFKLFTRAKQTTVRSLENT